MEKMNSTDFCELLRMNPLLRKAKKQLKELREELKPKGHSTKKEFRKIKFSHYPQGHKYRKDETDSPLKKAIDTIIIYFETDNEFNFEINLYIRGGMESYQADLGGITFDEKTMKIQIESFFHKKTIYILRKKDFLYLKQQIEETETEIKAILEALEKS